MRCIASLLIIFLVWSCSDGKVDTTKIKQEMKEREIRVIPEAKIISRTLTLGDSLVNSLGEDQGFDGLGEPVKNWQVGDDEIICSIYALDKSYELSQKEAGVFETYKYSAVNGLKADPNAQRIDDNTMVFNKPLTRDDKIVAMWSVRLPRKYVILTIEE